MKKTLLSLATMVLAVTFAASSQAEEKAMPKDSDHAAHMDHSKETIAEIVMENKDFSTLLAAVKAAGLAETLSGKGPFTVFAPTDAAFAKVDKATLKSLMEPENKAKLKALLTYHVVSGKVMAKDVGGMDEAKSVEGSEIMISTKNGNVMLNGKAKVTKTDIVAKNGVIHVIDTVIMPTKE